ncbi:PWWP domain-containing protein 2A-like [Planococcus citri]|uniref:PWWP domain-containing protein 2A-like n=1 Tax=Planococcus citri TaxID=170843 RepID=UPI0031F8481C
MAECNMKTETSDINLLKSTKILVYVEEALQDLLVVSYVFDSKFFQGILLDSSKRRIPAGIPLPTTPNSKKNNAAEEDILCKAINQRFTYFQDLSVNGVGKWNAKKTKNGKMKNTRMNVRLRPRQVLCSKCRSICNENSENVDHSKKASGDQPGSKLAVAVENSRRSLRLSTTIEKSPRPLLYENFKNHQMKTRSSEESAAMLTPSLVPKLARLQPNEIAGALNGKFSPKLSLLNGNCCLKPVIASPKSESSDSKFSLDGEQEFAVSLPEPGNIPQKSAVDMEIVANKNAANEVDGKMVLRKKHSIGSMEDLWDESVFEDQMLKTKTTPVLKISFGTEGQGTVLKIPAKITNNTSESEPDESHVETRSMMRAARKAHKKAKKEAKKRMIAITSPARSPAYENFFAHRSRHKIKRKRKHKYQRTAASELHDSDSEKNKNEKLSISFKRLGGNAYTATRTESPNSSPSSHSDEDASPGLPESAGIDLESIPSESSSYKMKNGKVIEVGDVIWGKVHGFSWWPGKVLTFKINTKEQNKLFAYISWFGSSTASVITCDNLCPFLDNYKLRFNKRKKSGQYKEAVKIATVEAKKKRGLHMRSRNSMCSGTSRF